MTNRKEGNDAGDAGESKMVDRRSEGGMVGAEAAESRMEVDAGSAAPPAVVSDSFEALIEWMESNFRSPEQGADQNDVEWADCTNRLRALVAKVDQERAAAHELWASLRRERDAKTERCAYLEAALREEQGESDSYGLNTPDVLDHYEAAHRVLTEKLAAKTEELVAAGELHLADETTIAQLERKLSAKTEELERMNEARLHWSKTEDRLRADNDRLTEELERYRSRWDAACKREFALQADNDRLRAVMLEMADERLGVHAVRARLREEAGGSK